MAAPAVPFDMEVDGGELAPPVPYSPTLEDESPKRRSFVRPTTEEGWRRGRKAAQLQLEAATEEVEKFKPTLGKLLSAVGLNIRESAAGSTKQAVGNITRTFTDLVAPKTPHEPGSIKHLLQLAVMPLGGPGALLNLQDQSDPESVANIVRQAGTDLAAEGTGQMKTAQELTEGLGGGQLVSGSASLASTVGASAPALLAAPLGLPAASVAAGLQSYGNNVDSFKTKLMERDPNLTEKEAFDKAMVPAAITGAVTGLLTRGFGGTERFIEQLASQGVQQQGFKAALREVLKSATIEAPEEFIDQLSQGFVEKAYVDPEKNVQDILSDAAVAGLTGFALGGATTGAISGVAHTGAAVSRALEGAAQRSRLRRGEPTRPTTGTIDEGKITTPSPLPAQQGQPAQPAPEIQTQAGAAQRVSPSVEGVQAIPQIGQVTAPPLTTDVTKQAVQQVVPAPPPAPAPAPAAPKRAVFGGYIADNPSMPTYKIPGARPGWWRDVSAETARKSGYQVPEVVPSHQEWVAAGRPATMEPAPTVENLSAAPRSPEDQQRAAAMLERFPTQSVREIASQFENIPTATITSFPGGLTRFWWQLGTMAKTQEDVAALKSMAERNTARVEAAKAAKDFDAWGKFGGLQPAEAYEYATGVTIKGEPKWTTFENFVPGYVPSVPDPKYLSAKGIKAPASVALQESARGVAPPQSQALTPERVKVMAGPIQWQTFAVASPDGLVIDPARLLAAIKNGKVDGGPALNALAEHLLTKSDLHLINPIRIYDTTPQVAAKNVGESYPFFGRYSLHRIVGIGTVEMVTKTMDGNPRMSLDFIVTLVHELIHNAVTSKLWQAPVELQQEAADLFNYVVEKSKGTTWESHNATSSLDEFLSEALSNPAFQIFIGAMDYTGRGKKREKGAIHTAYTAFLDILKKLLKLPDFIVVSGGQKVNVTTALDQAIAVSSDLQNLQRMSFGDLANVVNLSKAGPPPLGPNLAQAQVAGGAAEVGRIAEAIVAERESAGQALENLAYERTQYRNARQSIRQLNDLATASFRQQNIDPETVAWPDATAGISINEDGQIEADTTFVDALQVAGIQHNPGNVRSMQEEIFYEGAARRYNSLQNQITTLNQAVSYYQTLGVDEAEIQKVQKEIDSLTNQAGKLGGAALDDRLVTDRAAEMRAAEDARQERLGKVQSLNQEPVAAFFGREVGGYRNFTEKMQAGLNLAQQVMAGNPTPAALAEVEKWQAIPADIRTAILTGRQLSTEQRASIFATLAGIFEDYDFSRARMTDIVETRVPEINARIRELLSTIADQKVQQGMTDVLRSDVVNALNQESGMTGNLRSMAENQALKERISAIQSFAMAIGKDLETNRALFEWLANPSTPKPIIPPSMTGLGVDPVTLQMIVNEVGRNPDFGSSVLNLIAASDKKLSQLPITGLQQIEELLKTGTQENKYQAEAIAQKMLTDARAMGRAVGSEMRGSLSELDKLQIERRAIQEGLAMFQQLGAAPDFRSTRQAIDNSPYGLVEPMVNQNHTATTFKAFGAPGLPSHVEMQLDSARSPQFKSEWFKKVAEWHRMAQEYLNAYDTAAALHAQDPVANPSPDVLGYDLPKVRGLRDAVKRFVPGSFLELSLNSESKRWKVPTLARMLSKLSWFRQHDFVSKMVGGITGTDLRARLGDFVNHFLIAQSIRDQFRDLPNKMHAAMRSHPELGMNIANYREHFNEMAHWGRQFGSPLRAGFVLPRSGRTVTAQDMEFLQKERAYQEQLRRRVTESNPTQGVRVRTQQDRTLVRPGAFVGDEGVPRFLNRRADSFIAAVQDAYNEPVPPGSTPGTRPVVRAFDQTTSLGPSSNNVVVQFWNQRIPLLVQHVLDVRRGDRSMTLTPGMTQAQTALANDWMVNGVPSINSVEDLVNALVANHPPTPGVPTRDVVVNALNAELRQYRDEAQRIATDRAERDQARQSTPEIAFSAENEFTRPAAKLELPTPLYDYGAISPADHLTMASRANHERVLGYATAVRRAINEIQTRLQAFNDGALTEQEAAESYGGNIQEMKDVVGILREIDRDFTNAYAQGSFGNQPRGAITETLGLLTSAILALPTVGIRNMTQGQFAVYTMAKAMGLSGHRLTMWRALKNMPETVARFAMHALDGAVKRTNMGIALLTGKNRHFMENIVKSMADTIFQEDFRASANRVSELGLDNREAFLQRMQRVWQETSEFVDAADMAKTMTAGGRRVGRTAAMPVRMLRALFDKIGVQQYDFAINATSLNAAELLRKRLQSLAIDYGDARQNLGPFDPNNRAWDLKPSEWASFSSQAENEDSLAAFRLLLEGSAAAEGFQLERSMWNYYQQIKAGNTQAQLFTPEQFDSLTRKILAEFNASTPANRASATSANQIVRNLLLLQGYPSDLMLKIINTAIGSIRDRDDMANALVKVPAFALMALMAVVIGMFTSSLTGAWEKYVRGRQPSLATPLDKDFYTSFKRFGEGVLAMGAAQFAYLGDVILWLRGEVRGNRGVDPTGRILAASMLMRFINAIRGGVTTFRGTGNVADSAQPAFDVARSMVPFWLEAERVFDRAQGPFKQAERVSRGELQVQGILEQKGFTAATYGPTTILRRGLGEAVGRWFEAQQAGDAAGSATALERAKGELGRLENYHYEKYLAAGKDAATARQLAQRDTYNDYQEINPIMAANLGRRLTQGQFDLVKAGLTGERGQIFQRGLDAWQAGNLALFGRPGRITREEVDAGRAGIGGRGFPLPGAGRMFPRPFPRLPGFGAAARRAVPLVSVPPVRAVRSRLRRVATQPLARVRIGAARSRRRAAPKPPRIRGPSLARSRRTRTSRVRRVAQSRRRPYASA